MTDPYVFAASPLDRAIHQRREAAWLRERLEDPSSRFLPLWRLNVLVQRGQPKLAWARGEVRESMDAEVGTVLLGVRDGIAHFALDLSPLAEPERKLGVAAVAKFQDVRTIAGQLPPGEGAIVAQARSVIDWHARYRFCPACGGSTRSLDAGYMRVCEDCSAEHFPRTDPVAIMLVHRGDSCLLGRQAVWPPGMYSALAGFVEPGETIEEAVRREVMEETGVAVAAVHYHSSQPWPFPSSLMIGCLAEATTTELRIDKQELEEARWFPRQQVRRALEPAADDPELRVPPAMAIAHHLIRAWAHD